MKKAVVLLIAFILFCSLANAPSTTSYYRGSYLEASEERLYIGDYSVSLHECEESRWWYAQSIVDAEDSAVVFKWCGSKSPIIADHCNQGFDIIKDCEVGDTCHINEVEYECVLVDRDAVNARTDMFLSTGESFMKNNEAGFLFMYTCNEEGNPTNITVVVWKPSRLV